MTSVRSDFVTGFARLSAVDTRARLVAVRAAVYARLDELTDPGTRLALQMVADQVDRTLRETSRLSVERLAKVLDDSHRDPAAQPEPVPAGHLPKVPARRKP